MSTSATGLVRYDAMVRAIAEAYTVDEVKEIHDKARAAEIYARQAKNIEAERQVCEVRLRAERKAGQLLSGLDKARGAAEPGTNRGLTRSDDTTASRTLADMGISKEQSSSWQRLASVPDEDFEAALSGPERPKNRKEFPSASKIIRANEEPKIEKKYKVEDDVLWLWGALRDFERHGVLDESIKSILERTPDFMRSETERLAPIVGRWLSGVSENE